ncbi:hypothetical protein SDB74_08775 [Legionella pneumophila serogroup 1]
MYVSGSNVQQNDFQAMKWFPLAAKQRDTVAQYNIGKGFLNGAENSDLIISMRNSLIIFSFKIFVILI